MNQSQRSFGLFRSALDVAPEDRAAYLAEACGGDESLRREVEELLTLEGQAGDFLEPKAGATPAILAQPDPPTALKAIEGYEIIRELHRGGQGVVYEAFQESTNRFLGQLAEHSPKASRYTLKGEVARGGMGAILKVWDEDLQRNLAMKVVLGQGDVTGETPAVDETTLTRFLEEAKVTGQLDHPGVVPVHELGVDDQGCVYFTMRLVKGRDLRTILRLVRERKEGWTQTRALNVLLKACETLAYAHSHGVIHRDLKPANIMVGHFGEVYVMDWGLARVKGREDTKDLRLKLVGTTSQASLKMLPREEGGGTPDSPLMTMDGDIMGTPAYMSPEQARGDVHQIGPRSDVYAIGAILYELLTGHMPYVLPATRRSPRQVLLAVQEGPPRPLRSQATDLPAELEAICEKAMARDPAGRYADVTELADDLRAYLEQRVVSAYKTGAVAELRKWVVRNKGLAASLGAVFVLLLAGGGVFAWLSGQLSDKNTELTRTNTDLDEANTDLAATNTELDTSLADAQAQRVRADQEADAAKANAERADANAATAQENATRAEREKANVLRLSAFQDLEDLQRAADALWPATPERLPNYGAWLARADALVAGLLPSADGADVGHRRQLELLRARALPRTETQRQAERESQPKFDEWEMTRATIEKTETGLAAFRAGLGDAEPTAEQTATMQTLKARLVPARELLAALDAEIDVRQTYTFAAADDSWWQNQLTKLIGQIEAFSDPETGLIEGISEEFGWGIARRKAFAATIEQRTLSGADAQRRWAEASASIADHKACPAYDGLELAPQLGLLPIGRDAASGLWEFWHVLSGDEPQRGEDGKLVLTEASGIVLVLIPGGSFWMGAQAGDPEGRNYDPGAYSNESPVHEVTLSAYLLSKYELTQGQWERFAGRNPSSHYPGRSFGNRVTLVHPVEQVSWNDAMVVLPRLGLQLPSEAQWERAARGGTASVWWTGNERDSLLEPLAANLADQAAQRGRVTLFVIKDWPVDDGWTVHAPVDALRPNPFGLHHVHGNVWEWCLDSWSGYSGESARDPVIDVPGARNHILRGGSFSYAASSARSAHRGLNTPDFRSYRLGLRPAKGISP